MKTKLVFTAMVFLLLAFSTAGVYGQSAADAAFDRGMEAFLEGNSTRAIAEFTEAIRLNPNDYGSYMHRSMVYEYLKDWDRVIADCTQAIRLSPNDEGMYFMRGEAYKNKNDNTRVRADFEAVLRINPNNTEARQALASLPATPAPAQNNTALAQAAYERGQAAYEDWDFDDAIFEYTEAIRLSPNNHLYYHGRAWAYHGDGDKDRAIADFTQAIRIRPNADSYYGRGNAYYENRDRTRALADCNEALQLDPNHRAAKTLRDLISILQR